MVAIETDSHKRRAFSFGRIRQRLMKLVSQPGFQSWASRFPLTRRIARKDGEQLFDLVAGFAYSQVLFAIVKLDILEHLRNQPLSAEVLASKTGLTPERLEMLCNAGVALELLSIDKNGCYQLARLGAATLGVPGLRQMILHHDLLYQDIADPVAFLAGQTSPSLAEFWPYVRTETAKEVSGEAANKYSELMAASQRMVAEETLDTVDFGQFHSLMDVGGGTGAFLTEVTKRHPEIHVTLFDLPAVVEAAKSMPVLPDAQLIGGSFLEELPEGNDAISLIRVLYDHSDTTVSQLLGRVFDALPSGGLVIISEPMTGGSHPNRSGDVYFSLYTLAMKTGKARAPETIANFLENSGFQQIRTHKSARPFVTSVVTAHKP